MRTAALLLLLTVTASAQRYPRWFLEQGNIPCTNAAVAILRAPSLHPDTAVAIGFRTACNTLARYSGLSVKGGQAFWNTEAGTYSMGAEYHEAYDSTLTASFIASLSVVDASIDQRNTIVLAGDTGRCAVGNAWWQQIDIATIPQPAWVERLPDSSAFLYGVGTSEEYYYESSSWNRAEENAVRSLARSIRSAVTAVQKKDAVQAQELYNESIDVRIPSIRIIARWRNVKEHIFYVLARTPRR